MTVDPKNPSDDPVDAEGSVEGHESMETTPGVASDDTVEFQPTDEALDKDAAREDSFNEAPEQASGSGSRALVFFLVVALSLSAAAVGAALGPRILPQAPDTGLATLQTQFAALQSEVASLEGDSGQDAGLATRLDTLETNLDSLDDLQARLSVAEQALAALSAQSPDADTQRLDALAARIDLLESAPAVVLQSDGSDATIEQATNADLAELRDRARALIERIEALPQGSFASLAGFDERLAALEAATQANAAALGQVSDLDSEVAALGDQLAGLEAGLDTLENRAIDPGSAFVLAASRLHEAVATGGAYRDPLNATSALAPDDTAAVASLQALSSHADTGVATVKSLGDRLPDALSNAVTAERVATSDGFLDQTLAKLEGLVSVRRVDGQVEGTDADAVTSRAEAQFNEGNLDAALKELEGLSDEAAAAMSGWITDAKAHLDVDQALDDLHDRAIALVGGTVN
jgi:hypothetical protein